MSSSLEAENTVSTGPMKRSWVLSNLPASVDKTEAGILIDDIISLVSSNESLKFFNDSQVFVCVGVCLYYRKQALLTLWVGAVPMVTSFVAGLLCFHITLLSSIFTQQPVLKGSKVSLINRAGGNQLCTHLISICYHHLTFGSV